MAAIGNVDYELLELIKQANEGDVFACNKLAKRYIERSSFDEAKKFLDKALQKPNAETFSLYGLYYAYCRKYAKAASWYQKGLKLGDKKAKMPLGDIYFAYLRKYDKAINIYISAAKDGVDAANISIGDVYMRLNKPKKAATWYEKAAVKGSGLGAYRLAETFKTHSSEEKRIKWLTAASLQKISNAKYALGQIYADKQNLNESKKWFEAAADDGNCLAAYQCANIYFSEYQNYEKAQKYLVRALSQNVPYSGKQLIELCRVINNYESIIPFFNRVSVDFSVVQLGYLGKLYEDRKEYAPARICYERRYNYNKDNIENILAMGNVTYLAGDYDESESYYDIAAYKGNLLALIRKGDILSYGRQKYKDAVELYISAYNKCEKINPLELQNHFVNSKVLTQLCLDVATIYYTKLHSSEDAQKWFKKIGDTNAEAMVSFGIIFENDGDFKQAEEWYTKAAKFNSTEALVRLANLHENKTKDYQKAATWYTKGIQAGVKDCKYWLGVLYYDKANMLSMGLRCFEAAAQDDDSRANLRLADIYKEQNNLQKAIFYYEREAEKESLYAKKMAIELNLRLKNYSRALRWQEQVYIMDPSICESIGDNLLYNLNNGEGAAKWYRVVFNERADDKDLLMKLAASLENCGSIDEAAEYYLKAADMGMVEPINRLGNIYVKKENYELAAQWYTKGANIGNKDSLFSLAKLYHYKLRNLDLAKQYYGKCIANNDTRVQEDYNKLLTEMNSLAETRKQYENAVEEGKLQSLNKLAKIYEMKGDYEMQKQLYETAIKNGYVENSLNLAILYANKLKDYAHAEIYFKQAINSGNTEAYFHLAKMYEEKIQNYAKAEKAYLAAIKAGNKRAILNLGTMYHYKMKQYSKAKNYYLIAVSDNDIFAYSHLAALHEELGCKMEACAIYEKAIAAGDKSAYYLYGRVLDNSGNYEAAKNNYMLAIKSGFVKAEYYLGMLYYNVYGDVTSANQWLSIAAMHGVQEAIVAKRIIFSSRSLTKFGMA